MANLGDEAAAKFIEERTVNPVVFDNGSVKVYAAFNENRMGYLLTDPYNWA